MVTKALLDTCIKGEGKLHKTSVFPCGIFQMKTGINRKPGDPNYDLFQLALKSTAKRLYPNYCNCDWTNQKNAVLDDRNMKKEVLESLKDSYILKEDTLIIVEASLDTYFDYLSEIDFELKKLKTYRHNSLSILSHKTDYFLITFIPA